MFFVYQASTGFLFRSSLGFLPFDEERKSKLRRESKVFTFGLFLCVFQFTFSFFSLFYACLSLLLLYFYPCFTLLLVSLVHFHFTFTLLSGVFIFLFSLLLLMKGRRGKEEEEELKQKIRTLLEEGKTYKEIEEETGASRRTIAKVKKQLEKEEVGHRSPLESPPTEDEEGEIDEEEATKQLEAIDKAARNTALNEVITKVKTKAKLEINDIYQLGLVLKDVLQSEAGEEYYREAEKSGLPLDVWIQETLQKALWYRYFLIYAIWKYPDLYKVFNWSLDAFKLWYQELKYQFFKEEYERKRNYETN